MSLEYSDLDKVSTLSHLKLTDEERVAYLSQLQSILGHMEELKQLVLPELDSETPLDTPLRDDVILTHELNIEKNAPLWEAGCFQVPKMLEDV